MTVRPNLVPIDAIVTMLATRSHALALELFPRGVKDGHEWRVGSLAGEPGRSMAIHIGGARGGVWSDFSTGEVGDALDLVAQALFGGNKADALRWARRWLGLDDASPAELEQRRREASATSADTQKRNAEEAARLRASAMRIWLDAEAELAGTPVERYLAGRAIRLDMLARPPRAIRYHPRLPYWVRPPGAARAEVLGTWPAMVTAIAGDDGKMVAAHRTWLEVRPDGAVTKAPVPKPKMVLGGFAGGYIRLSRGASGKAIKSAPDGDVVAIAEGIEDGLSAALLMPDWRVIAAVSVSNMAAIALPPAIGTVLICGQDDGEGSQAARAVDAALRRFLGERRAVKVIRAPAPHKDLNDWLQAVLAEERERAAG